MAHVSTWQGCLPPHLGTEETNNLEAAKKGRNGTQHRTTMPNSSSLHYAYGVLMLKSICRDASGSRSGRSRLPGWQPAGCSSANRLYRRSAQYRGRSRPSRSLPWRACWAMPVRHSLLCEYRCSPRGTPWHNCRSCTVAAGCTRQRKRKERERERGGGTTAQAGPAGHVAGRGAGVSRTLHARPPMRWGCKNAHAGGAQHA